jgi:hypothetical protein
MPKSPSLSQRIAARASEKTRRPSHLNRAAFLALRAEIALALADGWNRKLVWENLRTEGRIHFGYDAFLRYVRQLIDSPNPPAPRPSTSPVASTPEATGPVSGPAPTFKGFTYNATPKKEELL